MVIICYKNRFSNKGSIFTLFSVETLNPFPFSEFTTRQQVTGFPLDKTGCLSYSLYVHAPRSH